MGSCLFTMYVRLKAARRDQRWYGWNVQDGMVPKRNIVLLNDDGLRLHCDKTKTHHHKPQNALLQDGMAGAARTGKGSWWCLVFI